MPDGAVFPQVRLRVVSRDRSPVKCPRAESAQRAQPRTSPDAPFDDDLIRDAMAQLSDRHRVVLYRSLYLKRTTTQIAAELGTADQLVKHDLHHALHALRITLHGAGERPAR